MEEVIVLPTNAGAVWRRAAAADTVCLNPRHLDGRGWTLAETYTNSSMRPFEETAPERRIVGYRQDDEGGWVAELECGHGQHVRHDPPWQVRPWVTTAEGRSQQLGTRLRCVRCVDPGSVA